jgi:hypothetical protein
LVWTVGDCCAACVLCWFEHGWRRFMLPDFHDIRHLKVVRSSPSRTGRLYPQECSWYSFSLGTESTPGPWCCPKEICHWKICEATGNRSRHRPTSSAAPYPLRHPRPQCELSKHIYVTNGPLKSAVWFKLCL